MESELILAIFLFAALVFTVFLFMNEHVRKTDHFTEEEIINIIGKALSEGENGRVGVYKNLGKICLYDVARHKDVHEASERLGLLLDYLKLEYKPDGAIVKK